MSMNAFLASQHPAATGGHEVRADDFVPEGLMRPLRSLIAMLIAFVGSSLTVLPGDARAPEATPVARATPAARAVPVAWQSTGGADLPFVDPFQLTIAPDGTLWVADGQNSRFQHFAPDGTFLEVWGTPGSGEGEFDFTFVDWDASGAMAFDAAGNRYVADPGNHRVQKFDPNGAFVMTWGQEGSEPGEFGHIYDIATDGAGRIYVIDDVRNDIQVFDGTGRLVATIASQGLGAGEPFDTGGLAVAPDGTIWVADWGTARLQQFSPEGRFLTSVGGFGSAEGSFRGPIDVAVDQEGRVFVVDNGNDRVQVFDREGRFLIAFGTFETDTAEFAMPAGIAVDDTGTLYVSDVGFDRVTAFRLPLGRPGASAATATP
jgi:DNA-binding beta-propeller fold protein YncE